MDSRYGFSLFCNDCSFPGKVCGYGLPAKKYHGFKKQKNPRKKKKLPHSDRAKAWPLQIILPYFAHTCRVRTTGRTNIKTN